MSQQVSPLRQRMIDDMTIRNMSPLTQKAYVRAVKNFSLHFMKSPDKLTFENVREYHLHLVSRGLSTATIIPIICGIRFFGLLAVWRGLRAANPCWRGRLAPPEAFLGSAGKGRFFVPA